MEGRLTAVIHSFYHSKHLKKSTLPEKFGQKRRWMELFLSVCIALMLISAAVFAVDGYAVAFVNYDLSDLNIAPIENVPEGARLYKTEELTDLNGFSPLEGCTWYLYYEGGGANESFGPKAIPDPPERKGYTFQDWAAQGSADDTIYTVTGNTTFVARYVSDNQYVVNLYYQFENESHTVAAQTSTVSYSWGSEISIPLPVQDSLKGLSPVIQGSNVLNEMLAGDTFSGTLDEAFLQACEDAGYLERDQETGGYQEDENGTIQINIPVTYALTGEVKFKVEYYLQNEEGDQYTLEDEKISSVTGTTHVNLNEMGLVFSYEGFALTAASMEDADSYDVSTDQNSVIKLYYDRNVHYVYYQMNGGNAREPVELRYGQSLPENLTAAPNRQGYTFKDWTWLQEDGTQTEIPTVMPDHDLMLSANWEGAKTAVTLVYWLENANDDSFTVAGQRKIEVISDQTVGYQVNADESVDVAINRYLTAEEMKQAGISDGEYFTFT